MSGRSRTVLVVDDSIGVQTAARDALRPLASVEVVCRGDVDGAERWLGEGRPAVALCDVVLPDRTGYDLCRVVKAAAPGCRVLLLSSPFETFDDGEASACGADGVVGKPFTAPELRSRVEAFLADATRGQATERPGMEAAIEGPADRVGEELPELSEADLVPAAPASARDQVSGELADALAARLVGPVSERLLEPLLRKVTGALEDERLPAAVERHIAEAAERLVRQRLREIEDDATATEAHYGAEEAD